MTDGAPRPPRRITPFGSTPAVASSIPFPLDTFEVEHVVHDALFEDRAFEDITTIATVLSDRRARAKLVARAPGTLAGLALTITTFRLLDDKMSLRVDREDGSRVQTGDTVLYLTGHARGCPVPAAL